MAPMENIVVQMDGKPGFPADVVGGRTMETPFSVSLSVPASPSSETKLGVHHLAVPLRQARQHSLPSPAVRGSAEVPAVPRSNTARKRDRRFDRLRTFSGRLDRQLSTLRGLSQELPAADLERGSAKISEEDTDDDHDVPTAGRYFDALEGAELDTLRSTEVAVLPKDELWPFLLRFPISAFGMCLGVSSQAMLWKTLESEPSMAFLRVCPAANHVLWWISVALTAVVSIVYLLKVVFYFEAVRREFHHPVRVNFFFAPWVACLFLVKGVPRPEWEIHHLFWYFLMVPILCLDLKIYGQWMSSGERRLSKVANPSNHLAVVGNFVGALLGARMGLRELPIFFFAVGLAHYAVLFVTLYQRLPTNKQLPKELHPVFFLFVAAPSVASMAWARISGEFNNGAKLLYFVSLFLYVSLVVRVNLFRGLRFSLAWWAYTFPMTSVALATVLYASEVNNMLTLTLAVGLSGIAVLTVIGVLATTVYHAFVCGDLFPNDVSIAIKQKRPKFSNILAHLRLPTPASSSSSSANSRTTSSIGESPVIYGHERAEC
ncbi:S-type anion channel SLAH2-like [Aegilops tauschii subsp. strangulata]|uniref:S-type anion channel SLAH2 n=3 Tax=Aegilops tauschii TaxID=37682 RepID=A0A453DQH4_AEGTS|nr:S-type anion channel SLAH2-like [Aegilops tauschii subsp. strangulata]